MPENKPKFSFSKAAASTSSRQRFSFSSTVPEKKNIPANIPANIPEPVLPTTANSTQTVRLGKDDLVKGVTAIPKAIAQDTARDLGSGFIAVATQDPRTEIDPSNNRFSSAVFGKEKFSFKSQANDLITGFGGSDQLADRIGVPVLAGLVLADFISGPGKKSAIKKALVKAKTTEDAVKVLRNAGASDEVIFGLNLAEKAAAAQTENAVELLLRQLEPEAPKPTPRFTIDNPPTPKADETVVYFNRTGGDKQYVALDPAVARQFGDDITVVPVKTADLRKTGITERDSAGIRLLDRSVADDVIRRNEVIPKQTPTPKFTAEEIAQKPKIDRRYINNFPELGSADRLAEIQTRTRGIRSNDVTLAAARQLGFTEERILNIPLGKSLNAEEAAAVSGIVENARLTLKAQEDQLAKLTPGTPEANSLREAIAVQKVKTFKLAAVDRGVAAEQGRALQARRADVDAIDQSQRWLEKYLADPKVSQDVKDYVFKRIGEFDGTPGEMAKLLRELNQASLLEMFVEFATAAKLWATQTHIVNVVSSLTRMLLNSPIHAISAVFDSTLAKLNGRARERFVSDAVSEIQGQMMGWRHAGHEAAKALKDENYAFEARKLKDFQPKGVAIKGRPGKNELSDKILDGFGKAVRTPFRILGVEDIVIRKPSEMGALYTATNRMLRMEGLKPGTKAWDEAFAKAIDEPSLETMQRVQDIADQNLFQEALHPTLKKMSMWREDVPALKLIVPFFRTIVNLQKQAIEFSALAPILPGTRRALKEGGGPASDALAKMTLGTAVTIPLIYYALEDKITLAAPTNPAQRDAFYAEGKQPYSFRVGDKWYPYHRFSPYSEWFVMSAAIAETVNNDDEKTREELMAHVFFTMTQNFFDKSFATGMHDFLDALADPERADNWVQNFLTGAFVPNIVPLVARTVDPVVRETETIKDAFISKVPYLSKTLPAKTDVFGEPISRPGTAVERFISPSIPSPVTIDLVREELDAIGYQMGFPGKTAGGFEMSDETYRIFQAASGKIVYQALFQLMQNPGYQSLTPRQRERAVDKVVRDTREAVKQKVAQEQLIMQEIKNRLKEQGYSTKQAEELAVKTYEVIKRDQSQGQPANPQ